MAYLDKLPVSLSLKFDSGSLEGTSLYTFNGEDAKTIDFKSGTNVTITETAGVVTFSSPDLAKGTTTGAGNVVTDVSVNGHMITLTKGINALTSESDTLQSVTGRGNSTTTTIAINNTTDSTLATTGAITTTGGVGIGKALTIGTTAKVLGTTASTSTNTGALIVSGGVGIAGATHIGGALTVGTGESTVGGNLTVTGNLTVQGDVTTLNTATLLVEDNQIVLNGNVTGTPALDAGIEIERGTSTNTVLKWNETTDRWEFTNDGTTFHNIPIPSEYSGGGGTVTSVSGGNGLTGSVTTTGSLALGTPSSLNATTSNAVTADSHTHDIETGVASGLSDSSTNTEGTSANLARADHTHAITGFALSGHTHAYSPNDHTHTYGQVMTSLTGSTSAATNGQLLIGDGADFIKANLTGGQGISIVNGVGSITIKQSDSVLTKTGAYTLTLNDSIILADSTSSPFTLTLPAASTASGVTYRVKKIDNSVNTVTIDANGTELIDGDQSITLAYRFQAVDLVCNGTQWYIL